MKKPSGARQITSILMVGACLLLGGCELDLYTHLSERDANAMLATLMANGIKARKVYSGDQGVNLIVDEAELARAIDVLSANGFPREEKETVGKIFAKNGIMSSPFEERVRYVYALEESVSKTLSEIDGILSARVHIVLPEEDAAPGRKLNPPSVAVFIKHRRGVDLDFFTPQIRRLVSNAIEGVTYDSVTVASVEAEPPQVLATEIRTPTVEALPGLGVRADNVRYFWSIMSVAGIGLGVLVLSNILTLVAFLRARRVTGNANTDPSFAAEPGE